MLGSLDPGQHLALVVTGAAGEDATVANRWGEGRRDPLVDRVDWLDVVMAVDRHGRRAGLTEPLGGDHWMAAAGHLRDLDLHPHPRQSLGNPAAGTASVVIVPPERADAGDGEELEEVALGLFPTGAGAFECLLEHSLRRG